MSWVLTIGHWVYKATAKDTTADDPMVELLKKEWMQCGGTTKIQALLTWPLMLE